MDSGLTPSARPGMTATPLHLVRLERCRVEQLLDLHQPRRETLLVMLREEILELLAIGPDTVRPEVCAHEIARGLHLLLHERQGHLAGGRFLQQREANVLRAREGLQESGRQPGMLRDQCALY